PRNGALELGNLKAEPASLLSRLVRSAIATNDDAPDDERDAEGEQQVNPAGSVVTERDHCPDHDHHDAGDYSEVHRGKMNCARRQFVISWLQNRTMLASGRRYVFEPISPIDR